MAAMIEKIAAFNVGRLLSKRSSGLIPKPSTEIPISFKSDKLYLLLRKLAI